jgi:hypothetical protein
MVFKMSLQYRHKSMVASTPGTVVVVIIPLMLRVTFTIWWNWGAFLK